MSDAAKKTDALEHIRELKSYEASKLNNLSHRIRIAKSGLDETAALVRERRAEVAKIVEAEKARLEAEAEKTAAVKIDAKAGESPEKTEKTAGQEIALAAPPEEKKPEKTAEESAVKPDSSSAKIQKAEKSAKAKVDIKKKVDEFFDSQELGEQGGVPSKTAEEDAAAISEKAAEEVKSEIRSKQTPRPAPQRETDPVKRAQAEAGMTTSYSSSGWRSGQQGQNQNYQGQGGYQNRPQG
ncbi:MAG: hypothetical protein LBP62_06885, partial [Clostridiales bacterium]|nr:hypothetical protein [Clostridiales bacterium]